MKSNSQHLRGVLLAFTGIILVSPDALLVRMIEVDRWSLIFWRVLLLGLTLAVYVLVRHRRRASARFLEIGPPGVIAAVLYVGVNILAVNAFILTSVANTMVILTATPLFSAIFSRLFLGEAVSPRTWLAVVSVLAGFAVIFSDSLGGGTLAGDLCALGTAVCLAGQMTAFRRGRAVNMIPSLALSCFLCAVVVLPLTVPLPPEPRDFGLLLVLGVVVLPVPIAMLALAPRYIPVPEISLIRLLETFLGPLWVWLVLSEVPGPETLLGGAIVIATVAIHLGIGLRQSLRRKPQPAAG